MSYNYLQLIPRTPSHLPPESAQEEARALFASLVPDAHEVKMEVSEAIRFIDCGANWESTFAPSAASSPIQRGGPRRWRRRKRTPSRSST